MTKKKRKNWLDDVRTSGDRVRVASREQTASAWETLRTLRSLALTDNADAVHALEELGLKIRARR